MISAALTGVITLVPVFEPGDLAIVNPRLPPTRGKDVILVADETEGESKPSKLYNAAR